MLPVLLSHGIDVRLDFRHTAPRELYALICRTEKTLVPGTVSGNPDKEAPGLARRPDYTLLIHDIISIIEAYSQPSGSALDVDVNGLLKRGEPSHIPLDGKEGSALLFE